MQKINFDQALESLIEAERSFAKASEEKGIRDAFLIFLDDSAIVFRPKPIKAKPLYAQRQQIPGSLSWKPIYADISLAGDMGYTTGPFEYRGRSEQDSADGCGFYVSVWQKQNDDSWQVMIDAGINCPCPDTAIAEVIINQQRLRFANTTIPEVDVETEKSKLLKAEFEFAGSAALKGIVNAYQVYLADDIRYYRMGELPVVGKENVCSKVNKKSGTMFWKPMASDVAFSGDLGYTYGIAQLKLDSGEIKSNSYLRIWKKNRNMTWKIVLDLANPIPPDIEKPQS
jgi:ketosteroid isomerase-like protein